MNVLIGCEESQAVTKAFRARGHNAYSCDILEPSGGKPEWHIKEDIFNAISLMDWDLGIFFPPCDFLTVSANRWLKDQPPLKSGKLVGPSRSLAQEKALLFVRDIMNCGINKIAIENPVGIIGSRIFWYCGGEGPDRWEVFPRHLDNGGRKPDQIIEPWQFGDGETKKTCLWLQNLPKLFWSDTNTLFDNKTSSEGREPKVWKMAPGPDRSKLRAKTYPGIAQAMAMQWG